MKYSVIFSDLDGTLLNSETKLSSKNKEAILKLRKMGVLFVPNTGRTLGEIPSFIFEEGLFDYIIYSNGAGIFDNIRKKNISYIAMDDTAFKKAIAVLFDEDAFVFFHKRGDCYISEKNYLEKDKYKFTDAYLKLIEVVNKIPNESFSDFIAMGDAEMLCTKLESEDVRVRCIEKLSEINGIKITTSGNSSVEILPGNAGKGSGIKRFLNYIGAKTEQVISIGDGNNDVEMVPLSALSLAVSNAVDELKSRADRLICSNDEHIAKYILEEVFN